MKLRWGVVKLFDSGQRELVTPAYSECRASELAGALRDRMSDADVAKALDQGWNYDARPLTGAELARERQKDRSSRSYQSRTQHRIAALTKRLRSREVRGRT